MLSLRRVTCSARSRIGPAIHLARSYVSQNGNDVNSSGDPGPSTSSFRRQQRSQLRQATVGGVRSKSVTLETLQAALSGSDASAGGARSSGRVPWQDRPTSERMESGLFRRGLRDNVAAPPRLPLHAVSASKRKSGRSKPSWRRAIDETPGQSKERGEADPYLTSEELRKFIQKHFATSVATSRPDQRNVGHAIAIVTDKPKGAVSVVVWNQLLHFIGRLGQLDKMWSLYNDMKKYGVPPSAHTYTTLLNAYASVAHSGIAFEPSSSPVEKKTSSRVAIIWQQAQAYLARPAAQRVETDSEPTLTPSAESTEEQDARAERSRLGPINAYAKFLARYRLWQELLQLLEGKQGVKWDITGYSTVMHGLLNAAKVQKRQTQAAKSDKEGMLLARIGTAARQVWDGAHQDLHLNQDKRGGFDANLASACLQGMLMGSPADQRYALGLIPTVFSVAPAPSTTPEPQLLSPKAKGKDAKPSIVKLRIDLPSATSLLKTLNVVAPKTAAAHFAAAFMFIPRIRQTADEAMIYAAATSYCNVSDVSSIIDLMDGYSQPWGFAGWKMGFWYDALTAARFAQDWKSLVHVARRMTLMPVGIEQGKKNRDEFKVEHKTVRDLTGKKWQEEFGHKMDARCMAIILKAALSGNAGRAQIGEAMRILDWAGAREVLGADVDKVEKMSSPRAWAREAAGKDTKQQEWTRELAKEVIRATENLLEGKDEGEADKWRTLQEDAQAFRKANAGNSRPGKGAQGEGSREGQRRMGTDKLWRR